MPTVRKTLAEIEKDRAKSAPLNLPRDEDIDYSDIPELDADFWNNAEVRMPVDTKTPVHMRVDSDVVEWFKSQGKGYQTRMNAVLRSFYLSQAAPKNGKQPK